MSDFDKYLHAVTMRAWQEAQDDGSPAIEAHHLLLAVTGEREPVTHEVLSAAGLDRETIRAAIDREFETSLRAAGVSRDAFDLPRPTYVPGRSMSMGASAKLAIQRGFEKVQRKKDLCPAHVLAGILEAQVGTVPRALALAGVDRADLLSRVRQALTTEDEAS
jgi:ATP-dependent Clp protease ATP-binding subunit ClpA